MIFGKRKKDIFLVLDVGGESVKALIFKKDENSHKINALAYSKFSLKEVLIDGGPEEIINKIDFRAIKEFLKKAKMIPSKILLGFPADILKARIVFHSPQRKNIKKIISKKEEDLIFRQLKFSVQEKISQNFSNLLETPYLYNIKILSRKIDGYEVKNLQGYGGEKLDFKILAVFLPKYQLKNVEKIGGELKLKNIKLVHLAESLPLSLKEPLSGIFLDLGAKITQVFLMKEGVLENVSEFSRGSEDFSEAIRDVLGMNLRDSKNFKERYSRGELSEDSTGKIKKIIQPALKSWLENLKSELKKYETFIPLKFFLFGAASRLPEIKDIIEKEIVSGSASETSFISLKNLIFCVSNSFVDNSIDVSTLFYCAENL